MPPGVNITTTTNQYLAPAWVDQVLRDNWFFGRILEKTEKWDGSQMLFPIKYQKGVASVAFNGFDVLPITQQPVSVNMTFYSTFVAEFCGHIKSSLIDLDAQKWVTGRKAFATVND